MARRTEDHPLEYATFEGVIPHGGKLRGGYALTRIREGKDET